MARITSAAKQEVLRELIVEEYGNKLTFRRDGDGSANLIYEAKNPSFEARDKIRAFVKGLNVADAPFAEDEGDEGPITSILAKLDELDAAETNTWGEKEPRPLTAYISLDREVVVAIMALFEGGNINYTVTETIRKAVGTGSDW